MLGGTQGMVLSAAINNPSDAKSRAGPQSMLLLCADNVCVVIGDHEVSVECRRSHRADVREGRTRGPDTRLCHQQRPVGPLAARASMDCRGIANARDRSVTLMSGCHLYLAFATVSLRLNCLLRQ